MSDVRVSHIGMCVSDWRRSLRFYHDLLGFEYVAELSFEGEPSATLLELDGVRFRAVYLERDGLTLELLHYDEPAAVGDPVPRPMNRLGFTHLSLRVDDLDATVAELADAGVRVLDKTRIEVPAARAKAVFVTDPDGLRIELVQRPGD